MFKHSKLKRTLSLFLVLTLFLAVLPSTSLAEEPINSDDTVTPISIYAPTLVFPNYATASSYQEKLDAVQLPESVLEKISTKDLIHAILSTPTLTVDIFCDNNRKYGDALDYIAHWYNTICELAAREDSGSALLEVYSTLDFSKLAADGGEYYYMSDYAPLILELLLGRDVHFSRLTEEQRETLFEIAEQVAESKVNFGISFGLENLFVENLDNEAIEYIQGECAEINWNPESDHYTSETIYTYGGLSFSALRWIDGMQDDAEDNDEDLRESAEDSCPGIVYVSSATERYNCHSYAWHNPSSENTVFIEGPGTYISCTSSTETTPSVNAIVVYYKDTSYSSACHSGVVTGVSGNTITVTSKWGRSPLFTHTLENVPNGYKANNGQVVVKFFDYSVHKYEGRKYAIDGSQHHTCCSLCYEPQGTGNPEEHTLTYTEYSKLKHRKRCTECNLNVLETHGYTGWGTYDATYHRRFCLTCGYYDYEAHTPNSSNTLCTVCNAVGPFLPIMKSLGVENEPEEHDHGGDCCGH